MVDVAPNIFESNCVETQMSWWSLDGDVNFLTTNLNYNWFHCSDHGRDMADVLITCLARLTSCVYSQCDKSDKRRYDTTGAHVYSVFGIRSWWPSSIHANKQLWSVVDVAQNLFESNFVETQMSWRSLNADASLRTRNLNCSWLICPDNAREMSDVLMHMFGAFSKSCTLPECDQCD